MSQWDFNNAYRPYHLRSIGEFSLSKVSLDDRDLPRPMKDGNRVKAYYAYDVVSGAVVGYAYNRYKTTELFWTACETCSRPWTGTACISLPSWKWNTTW